MMENMPMDASENYKRYTERQLMQEHTRNSYVTNPLLNPLNWAKFIQSIKRGEFSKDKKKWFKNYELRITNYDYFLFVTSKNLVRLYQASLIQFNS